MRDRALKAQRGADRGRRGLHAKLLELTVDEVVAQGVLLVRRMINCHRSWSSGDRPSGDAGRPNAYDRPPVPAQQRVGLDEEQDQQEGSTLLTVASRVGRRAPAWG